MIDTMSGRLTKEELTVCRILYFAIHNKNCVCDPTKFSEEEEQILAKFQEEGFLRVNADCIVVTKEFNDALEQLANTNHRDSALWKASAEEVRNAERFELLKEMIEINTEDD
jgi:hypothetical protein